MRAWHLSIAAVATATCLGLSGCAASDALSSGSDEPTAAPSATPAQVDFAINVRHRAKQVPVDRRVVVRASKGSLESVSLRSPNGPINGQLSPQSTTWRAGGSLRPATTYTLTTTGVDDAGRTRTQTTRFRTRALTLEEQTYPSFVPMDGATVGIAMPAIIRFDVPVVDKKSIQKHLKVTSAPAQPGAFHWISDVEVHWRPKNYWQPGTRVTVQADIGGVPAGNGIYGQLDRTARFTVGRAQIVKVDAAAHRMRVMRGGVQVRDFPITTGKPGFTTRSGTKVIMEKFPTRRMNSETVGIARGSSEAYDIDDVRWAMRVTYSGEFIHAAPWSVGSQGHANVSHGCTGMSTSDAQWLYDNTLIGDPVEYTGTDRPMTLTNGYGDWNMPFSQYRSGSAL